MANRPQVTDEAGGFREVIRRIKALEDIVTEGRALPPGYAFQIAGANLEIVRKSDGATATLVFT